MVDPRSFQARIHRLRECLALLRTLAARPQEAVLSDPIAWSAIERNLEVASECMLDLGNQLVAECDAGAPQDYKDIFRLLEKAGVLTVSERARYEGWAGFRNVLVHLYLEVDRARVWEILQNDLGDLEAFLVIAVRRLP
ncbi:MAG: DUF86 domain-containing protein [Candidatus Wallbacteria bacterium]|nr:DUF86 domain-containing protein [Candidatus Wallbacteria bacterium]